MEIRQLGGSTKFGVGEDEVVLLDQTTPQTLTGYIIVPDVVKTRDGVITRTDGYITKIEKTGGRTIDFTRDINNRVTSVTDSDRTWSFTRDINNKISEWSVT